MYTITDFGAGTWYEADIGDKVFCYVTISAGRVYREGLVVGCHNPDKNGVVSSLMVADLNGPHYFKVTGDDIREIDNEFEEDINWYLTHSNDAIRDLGKDMLNGI